MSDDRLGDIQVKVSDHDEHPLGCDCDLCFLYLRHARLEDERDALKDALEGLLRAWGGHNHWDSTMMHGAGCEACIRWREATPQARAALALCEKGE